MVYKQMFLLSAILEVYTHDIIQSYLQRILSDPGVKSTVTVS